MSTSTLLTAEELFKLPDDGMVHELVRGELKTMPPAGDQHGRIGTRLLVRMSVFAESKSLGFVYQAQTGFLLTRDPDMVRSPDVAFVSQARLPKTATTKFVPFAPDLAVEVVSPSESAEDIYEKIQDYLAHGVRLIWIIYPRTRTAEVYRPNHPAKHLPPTGTLTGEDLLPGFECKLADLFT